MTTGREHIVALPTWFFILRVVQIVLAVIVLGLAGYCLDYAGTTIDSLALTVFTVIYTWIILGYYLATTIALTSLYNLWAVLALEIGAVIFWLCSMAVLAKDAACLYGDCYDTNDYFYMRRDLTSREPKKSGFSFGSSISDAQNKADTYRGCFAGAAGLSGLLLLLFIITIAFFSVMLHRHRKAGAPQGAASSTDPNATPQSYSMVSQAEKGQTATQPQQYYPPPQQQPVYQTTPSPPPNTYEASATPAPYQPSVSPVSQPGYGQPAPQQG